MTEPVQKPKGTGKQDYGTPWDFVRAVARRFGPVVFDLAASAENAKAKEYFTAEQDALKQDWVELSFELYRHHGVCVAFLNPPFADIRPWAAKCEDWSRHRPMGVAIAILTPASIGANWFADHVHKRALVLGLHPKITFEGTTAPYPKDVMLSVFGEEPGFDVWNWQRLAPAIGGIVPPPRHGKTDVMEKIVEAAKRQGRKVVTISSAGKGMSHA